MIATNLTTSFRKRQRRHAKLPIAMVRDRLPVRVIVLPAPGSVPPVAAPEVPADALVGWDDLDRAGWEDAEWR